MSTSTPTVLLLHRMPGRPDHVDWLIATDPAGRAPLESYRLARRLDEVAPGEVLDAERIADHRPRYLAYEGPIGKGRGSVRRLRRGTAIREAGEPGGWRMRVCWQGGVARSQVLLGAPIAGAAWRIRVAAAPPDDVDETMRDDEEA